MFLKLSVRINGSPLKKCRTFSLRIFTKKPIPGALLLVSGPPSDGVGPAQDFLNSCFGMNANYFLSVWKLTGASANVPKMRRRSYLDVTQVGEDAVTRSSTAYKNAGRPSNELDCFAGQSDNLGTRKARFVN